MSTTYVQLCFSEDSKGDRLYNPMAKNIVVRRDVVFEETKGQGCEEDQDHHGADELTWKDDDVFQEESEKKDNNGGGGDEIA